MEDFIISHSQDNRHTMYTENTHITHNKFGIYEKKIFANQIAKKDEQLQIFDDCGRFSGYASVFSTVDNVNDIIMPGAFRDNLKRTDKIRLLWQHDSTKPIGTIDKLSEDAYGLYAQCQIFKDLSQGREAYFLIKKGAVRHMSIGYSAEDFFYKGEVRYIRKIKLWEISVVTFAANKKAKITDIKSLRENAQRLEAAVERLNKKY